MSAAVPERVVLYIIYCWGRIVLSLCRLPSIFRFSDRVSIVLLRSFVAVISTS